MFSVMSLNENSNYKASGDIKFNRKLKLYSPCKYSVPKHRWALRVSPALWVQAKMILTTDLSGCSGHDWLPNLQGLVQNKNVESLLKNN